MATVDAHHETAAPLSYPSSARGNSTRLASRPRLLVVDDEPVMGTVMRRIFTASHDVTVAASGRAALALFDAGREFEVVLCDVVMPDLCGPQLYEIVRERRPELAERFVFVTGGAVQEKNRAFLAKLASRVLYKPFDLAAVRDLVRRIAARASKQG